MKKTLRIIAALMAVMICAAAFASCGGSKPADADNQTTEAQTTEAQGGSSDVDYSNVAATIKFGDFDGMVKFLKEWEKGTYDNKVVVCEGENATQMSSCSIMEKKSSEGRGFSWEIIDGKFPDDYPADGAKIKITGVFEVNNLGVRILKVPADKVEELD